MLRPITLILSALICAVAMQADTLAHFSFDEGGPENNKGYEVNEASYRDVAKASGVDVSDFDELAIIQINPGLMRGEAGARSRRLLEPGESESYSFTTQGENVHYGSFSAYFGAATASYTVTLSYEDGVGNRGSSDAFPIPAGVDHFGQVEYRFPGFTSSEKVAWKIVITERDGGGADRLRFDDIVVMSASKPVPIPERRSFALLLGMSVLVYVMNRRRFV